MYIYALWLGLNLIIVGSRKLFPCKKLLLWFSSVTSLSQLLHSMYGLHYNVMMMSVLQEVKGLTKELYFPGGSPVSMLR